jgi:hypothetical protein
MWPIRLGEWAGSANKKRSKKLKMTMGKWENPGEKNDGKLSGLLYK